MAAGNGPALTYYVREPEQRQPGAPRLWLGEAVKGAPRSRRTAINGGIYQQWTFVPLADGNDLIVNVASGLGDPRRPGGLHHHHHHPSISGRSTAASTSNGISPRGRRVLLDRERGFLLGALRLVLERVKMSYRIIGTDGLYHSYELWTLTPV